MLFHIANINLWIGSCEGIAIKSDTRNYGLHCPAS